MQRVATLERAVENLRTGRLDEAREDCLAILQLDPRDISARLVLGAIEMQAGNPEAAEPQFRAAVEIDPGFSPAWTNLGAALRAQQRFGEALDCYDRALTHDPVHIAALLNRGNVLRVLRKPADALKSYDRVLALAPGSAEALHGRAGALAELNRPGAAVASYRKATAANTALAESWNGLGTALMRLKRHEEARDAFVRATAVRPNYPDAHVNLANVLRLIGQPEDAIESYDRAIALQPRHARALNNRGSVLRELGLIDAALSSCARAVSCDPSSADFRFNLGMTQLLAGRWKEGWEGYEARFARTANRIVLPETGAPRWAGEDLRGKRICLVAEQGLGDVIQFARFVPRIKELDAEVSVIAPVRMHRLLSTAEAGAGFLSPSGPWPPFDFHLPLMSIPRAYGLLPANVGTPMPYLFAEQERVEFWRDHIGEWGFRVGVCWQGSPLSSIDRGRSIPLESFRPLLSVPGIRLVSLQKHHGLEQIQRLPPEMPLELPGEDFDEGPDSFLDAAAIMANLDLVITCDTAIAHLAGALAMPVWIALKPVPDWRWMMHTSASPWYPTAQLFRRGGSQSWEGLLERMADALVRDRPQPWAGQAFSRAGAVSIH